MRQETQVGKSKWPKRDQQSVAARYRDAIAAQWLEQHSDFVETQSFLRLVPDGNGEIMRYLHPRWFLPGKERFNGVRSANWEPLSRRDLLAAAQDPQRVGSSPGPLRIAIVAGGGVGKSTNMKWLEACLNTDRTWAILLRRGDLAKQGDIVSALVRKVMSTANDIRDIKEDNVANQLRDFGEDGRLIILIDHLDEVRTTNEAFAFLHELPASWRECGFVLAGRPSAFQAWKDGADSDAIDARDWQFIEPAAFTDAQAEQFADRGGVIRYRLAKRQLGPHCSVPRILQFLRELNAEEIKDLHTPAELYDRVVRKLLAREENVTEQNGHAVFDADRACCLLSALAFVSWHGTRTNEDFISLTLNRDVKREVLDRVRSAFPSYTGDQMREDQRRLTRMTLLISDASLEANAIEWSSRTIVEFLASQWLACHSGGFIRSTDEKSDITALAVFYPEDAEYVTYEMNQFLADFPADRLTPSSWLACVRRWYDPGTRESYPQRRWSAEMLYRSWRTMHAIACRPVRDWWDVPYETLALETEGTPCAEDRGKRVQVPSDPETARRAAEVLDKFFGDLQQLLEGDNENLRAAAQEMIAEPSWCPVPTGQFYMGTPPSRQGLSGKLEHFCRRELGNVQTRWIHEDPEPVADGSPPRFRKARDGEDVAQRAAEWLTKKEWFTGLTGVQLRKDDIQWLANVLRAIGSRDAVDVTAPDYKVAYEKMERKWRKRDEVPLDPNPQHVAAFTLHRYPILHRWFWLFAPGHRSSVEKYLGDFDGTPHPPENHPVIYVSWFDAWAFCQWATWRVPGRPGHMYKLRLPHEPEWEYAVRWRVQDGQVTQTPMADRYWWGDSFYANEELPEDLTPRKDFQRYAHVKGRPGATGAPADLEPNGLGLYDTLGNVWEWMANLYDLRSEEQIVKAEETAIQSGQAVEPIGYSRFVPRSDQQPLINALRPMRGGLWYYLDMLAACPSRYRLASNDDRDYKMGFRVVREEWNGDVRCPGPAAHDGAIPALPPVPLPAVVLASPPAAPPAPSLASDIRHGILFLAANPFDGDRLALGREARAIREELQRAIYRECFDVIQRWDAEPLDPLRELRDLRPTIVHFSGHGGLGVPGDRAAPSGPRRDIGAAPAAHDGVPGQGLWFQALDGPRFVPAAALVDTFRAAGDSVKLVILNACYSDELATSLVAHVDCVVGMGGALLDEAAIHFATHFYGGLGAGWSLAAAYLQGRAAIYSMGLSGQDQPVLKLRAGVDAEQFVLVKRYP